MTPTVFITARFRSGSTMLWNIFRQVPEVVAYYEPLHEKLPQWIASGVPPQPSHSHIDAYFREYPPVEELKRHHMAEFGVCRLYLEAEEPYPDLKRYIQYLIDFTPADCIPVFQFNRVDLRLSWLKANFPDIPLVHLYRSPRDQWCSSIAEYPGDIDHNLDADPFLITTWARELCLQFPFLARPYIRHAYQRFYFLWKLSYLLGGRFADLSVTYEDILQQPERIVTQLLQISGLENQNNLKSCTSVILEKPVGCWRQYRGEKWFAELEHDCDEILKVLDLERFFGKKPLSKIIAGNGGFQKMTEDFRVYTWAIQNSQLSCIQQEIISEEKENAIRKMRVMSEDYILQMKRHPLRLVAKRYLPRPLKRLIRQVRQEFQPKLGQFEQYAPKFFKSTRYDSTTTSPTQQSWPNISLVTPSLNQGRFLERTLYSVARQNYPNLEYMVQDGGSIDETSKILANTRSLLTSVKISRDTGQADALNRGFEQTNGDIMAWLNSDDLLLPGTLAYVADYFLKHPDVDVVYGHRIVINEDDQEVGRWVLPPHDDNILIWADYIPQETLFWRRSIWEKAGGYVDESFHFALDWELLLRFRDASAKFVRLPRFMGAFRVHPRQKTSQELESKGFQEMARLRRRIHGREISNQEALLQIRHYLRKHLIYDWLSRLGIFRF